MRPIPAPMLTRGSRLTMALVIACSAAALLAGWLWIPGVEFTSPSLIASAGVAGLSSPSNGPQTSVTQAKPLVPHPGPPPALAPVTGLFAVDNHAAALLDLMNAARLAAGTHELVRDPALDYVALVRARDLLRLGYFGHYGPEGESAFTELRARGFAYRIAGENLARNNYPEHRTVRAAFEALMASPSHRANIAEPRFNSTGLAAVRHGKAWLYVVIFTD